MTITSVNMPLEELDKPNLLIQPNNLTSTARALAAIIAKAGHIYSRGFPVRIVRGQDGELPRVEQLTPDRVVLEAHSLATPVIQNRSGQLQPDTLPDRAARLCLALDDWGLQPLHGVTSAPILAADGSIRNEQGYEPQSRLWSTGVSGLDVPDTPTAEEAQVALSIIRKAFHTFPFADTSPLSNDPTSVSHDESALIAGLMTAVCRASLPLAPGLLITAPQLSGAGTGKGLLVRAISTIAYGHPPRAITKGHDLAELDKRIGSALMEAAQVLFLDNVNGIGLRSDLLASTLTEPKVDMRPLGTSKMIRLNTSAFVTITGNGLRLSEDLTRRFLVCELNTHTENAEDRRFKPGFIESIQQRRTELLSAYSATIWARRRDNQVEKRSSWRERVCRFDCRWQGSSFDLIVVARHFLDTLDCREAGRSAGF